MLFYMLSPRRSRRRLTFPLITPPLQTSRNFLPGALPLIIRSMQIAIVLLTRRFARIPQATSRGA